jgi:hypothetical protein
MGLFDDDVRADMADPEFAMSWQMAEIELALLTVRPTISFGSGEQLGVFSSSSGKVVVNDEVGSFRFAAPAWTPVDSSVNFDLVYA